MTQRSSGSGVSHVVVALVAAIALLLPAAGLAKKDKNKQAKDSDSVVSFYATTIGRTEFEIVIAHYWSSGSLFRSETVVSGHSIVTIVGKRMYYTYDGLTKKGYAVPRTKAAMAQDKKRKRPFGNDLDELLAAGGEKIKSETMNGVEVDVYRVTDGKGRRTLWTSSGTLRLPVRLENYDRQSGRAGTLDWVTWLPGIKIDDAFFEPSPDIELVRFKSYDKFLLAVQDKPVTPVPPLFHYLLDHTN